MDVVWSSVAVFHLPLPPALPWCSSAPHLALFLPPFPHGCFHRGAQENLRTLQHRDPAKEHPQKTSGTQLCLWPSLPDCNAGRSGIKSLPRKEHFNGFTIYPQHRMLIHIDACQACDWGLILSPTTAIYIFPQEKGKAAVWNILLLDKCCMASSMPRCFCL